MPGLPKVMQQKRDRMKSETPPEVMVSQPAQAVLQHMDAPSASPVNEASPPSEAAPTPEAAQPSKEEQLRQEMEVWEQRYRSLQGVVNGLEPQLRSERELREKLEKEMQALREAIPPAAPTVSPDEEWTEEELEQYGQSRAVIEKAARKIARGELSSALKDMRKAIEELREQTGRVQQDVSKMTGEQFYSVVRTSVPNFDKIIQLNEWQNYVAQKAPYSRDTIGKLLERAHDERDLETIQEIFKSFKPSKSTLAAMTHPPMNGGGAPINDRPSQKAILKWSDRKKLHEDLKFGRIRRTDQAYIEMERAFREAEAEGRVDYQH